MRHIYQLLTSGNLSYWLFQQFLSHGKPKIVPNFSDKPITNLNKLCLLHYLLNELDMQPKSHSLSEYMEKDYSKLKMMGIFYMTYKWGISH